MWRGDFERRSHFDGFHVFYSKFWSGIRVWAPNAFQRRPALLIPPALFQTMGLFWGGFFWVLLPRVFGVAWHVGMRMWGGKFAGSVQKLTDVFGFVSCSASTSNVAKIEEMERLLREAQVEKHRLLEHRVRTVLQLTPLRITFSKRITRVTSTTESVKRFCLSLWAWWWLKAHTINLYRETKQDPGNVLPALRQEEVTLFSACKAATIKCILFYTTDLYEHVKMLQQAVKNTHTRLRLSEMLLLAGFRI